MMNLETQRDETSDEDIKYVMIPEGLRDFQWLQGIQKGKEAIGDFKGVRPLSFFNGHFNESRFYVLHPDLLQYIRNRIMTEHHVLSPRTSRSLV
ncbi:alpha-N-acetylgalactosaminide alpha-2,6-sialyltransferase 1-like isoform X2 [Triplophysa dalaica]|uniref:alpha-N-acetylgalactosaminide alpha-2,6-sialyltransferase 1-like isoform X2 n=1 Tax=Triplophysa dalaica TaxID=1582913 RepID=UPI0024DF7286|nr:alpha-N-acetylgalactosaminide alpha-2,6-sialyltransferase 1-like isoform X2 [Triplophysa dalaica]